MTEIMNEVTGYLLSNWLYVLGVSLLLLTGLLLRMKRKKKEKENEQRRNAEKVR